MFLSAISQMWIFAAYELLRTWRQAIGDINRQAALTAATAPARAEDEGQPELVELWRQAHVDRARSEPAFVEELTAANASVLSH